MPLKHRVWKICPRDIQNALVGGGFLRRHLLYLSLSLRMRLEEVRWRQLLIISKDYHLLASENGPDGISRWELGSLVEDNKIKREKFPWQVDRG